MNTGVGCHALLQGIFPTQRSNLCLLSPALTGRFFTTSHLGSPGGSADGKQSLGSQSERERSLNKDKGVQIQDDVQGHIAGCPGSWMSLEWLPGSWSH